MGSTTVVDGQWMGSRWAGLLWMCGVRFWMVEWVIAVRSLPSTRSESRYASEVSKWNIPWFMYLRHTRCMDSAVHRGGGARYGSALSCVRPCGVYILNHSSTPCGSFSASSGSVGLRMPMTTRCASCATHGATGQQCA